MTTIEKIRAGIQKQQDLWKLYNQTKPTEDMTPGEKKRRIRMCEEIYQEFQSVHAEVQRLDKQMKEERFKAVTTLGVRK